MNFGAFCPKASRADHIVRESNYQFVALHGLKQLAQGPTECALDLPEAPIRREPNPLV